MTNVLFHFNRCLLLILILVLTTVSVQAEEIKSFEIYIDSTGQETVKTIDHLKKWSNMTNLMFTQSNFTYWGRFKLLSSQEEIIEFTDSRIDYLEIYQKKKNGWIKRQSFGDHIHFQARDLQHKNFSFLHHKKQGEEYLFVLKSEMPVGIRIKTYPIRQFLQRSLAEYIFLGLFYGASILIILLNLSYFLRLKRKVYLYYSLFVLFFALFSLSSDGLGAQYLWSNNQWDLQFSVYLLFAVCSEMMYIIHFLKLNSSLKKVFYVIIIIRILYFLTGFLIAPSLLNYLLIDLIPLIISLGVTIKVYQQGYQAARFFIVGLTLLMAGFLVYGMGILGWVPINVFTVYPIHFAVFLDFVLLTIAFADRLRIERNQKEQAQKESIDILEEKNRIQEDVNLELERKVQQRTAKIEKQNQELSSKNIELAEMQEKLWQMNSKMDKLNWELSKSVSSELQQRIDGERVSFTKFKEVYPTESTIKSELHHLKCQKGFTCKTCQSKKYKEDASAFTRTCSSCGYRESATANTLLHGVRFDKQKAFYLLYLFLTFEDIDVKKLSEELSLRLPTIYDFRKKVQLIVLNDQVSDWKMVLVQ